MTRGDIILAMCSPLLWAEVQSAVLTRGGIAGADARLQNIPQILGILDESRTQTEEDAYYMALAFATLTIYSLKIPKGKSFYSKVTMGTFPISQAYADKLGGRIETDDIITGKVDSIQEYAKKLWNNSLNPLKWLWKAEPDQSFDVDSMYEFMLWGKEIDQLFKRASSMANNISGLVTGFSGAQTGDPASNALSLLDQVARLNMLTSAGPYRDVELGGPLMNLFRANRNAARTSKAQIGNVLAALATSPAVLDLLKKLTESLTKAEESTEAAPNLTALGDPWLVVSPSDEVGDPDYVMSGDAFDGAMEELGEIMEEGGPLIDRLRKKRKLRRFLADQRALAKVRKRHKKKSIRMKLEDADFDPRQLYGSQSGTFGSDVLQEAQVQESSFDSPVDPSEDVNSGDESVTVDYANQI